MMDPEQVRGVYSIIPTPAKEGAERLWRLPLVECETGSLLTCRDLSVEIKHLALVSLFRIFSGSRATAISLSSSIV